MLITVEHANEPVQDTFPNSIVQLRVLNLAFNIKIQGSFYPTLPKINLPSEKNPPEKHIDLLSDAFPKKVRATL